jgi:MoaA/NifB/PqqE/SkfB family radical SAM enzyme
MYIVPSNIQVLQLDHTSRCNLGCPQCARMWDNGKSINPSMPITDLTLDDYKILLEPLNKKELTVFHCGNFGDALASPTFDETLDYCLDQKVKLIKISTNGSLRSADWWKELAKKTKDRNMVIFAIDGLEDTNHIYRVNSNWKKITENAQAFIDAGGWAQWNFLEFEHNYHQIEEARKIASDMGFKKFSVKYTARFADQKIKELTNKKGDTIKDRDTNHNRKDLENISKTYRDFDHYVNETEISCKFKQDNSVFVDMCMKLWPCCWMGAPSYFNHQTSQTKSFDHFWSLYGKDFNDMRIHGWKVLEHEFYQRYLENSWISPDDRFKRIYTCGRTCGGKFEFSSGHGKNKITETLTVD